jgi:hypothetical protein
VPQLADSACDRRTTVAVHVDLLAVEVESAHPGSGRHGV